MQQNATAAGSLLQCSEPRWSSGLYNAFPDPLAGFKGVTSWRWGEETGGRGRRTAAYRRRRQLRGTVGLFVLVFLLCAYLFFLVTCARLSWAFKFELNTLIVCVFIIASGPRLKQAVELITTSKRRFDCLAWFHANRTEISSFFIQSECALVHGAIVKFGNVHCLDSTKRDSSGAVGCRSTVQLLTKSFDQTRGFLIEISDIIESHMKMRKWRINDVAISHLVLLAIFLLL